MFKICVTLCCRLSLFSAPLVTGTPQQRFFSCCSVAAYKPCTEQPAFLAGDLTWDQSNQGEVKPHPSIPTNMEYSREGSRLKFNFLPGFRHVLLITTSLHLLSDCRLSLEYLRLFSCKQDSCLAICCCLPFVLHLKLFSSAESAGVLLFRAP